MTTLKAIVLAASLLLPISLASTGCSDKNSCEAAVDHTLELMPKEMAEAAGKNKAALIKKCEGLPEAERKCALAAKSLEDLGACSQKRNK